jgi:NitT/TauT family transport system substrate-binding protein
MPALMTSPRSIIVVMAVALGACGAQGPAPQAAQAPLRLGLATQLVPPVPNSVLWLAKDDGFYQREGLDVDLLALDGTPRVMAAMLAGDVDVGNVSTDEVLRLSSSGQADLRALSSPDPRQFFLIASRSAIGSVGQLRGRTIAISAIGGLDDTTTRLVLRSMGVAAGDLQFAAVGDPTARAAALVAGRIDATTISTGTWSTISDFAGVRVLVSAEAYHAAAPIVSKVDAVTATTLAAKRTVLRRFTRAVLAALRRYAGDRGAWVLAMERRRPDLSASRLNALWDQFRGAWAVDGGMSAAQLQATADMLYGSDQFRGLPRVPIARWTDLADLQAALGGQRGPGG